ncbi:hypothetical protein KI387_013355, partial [Taxus chinensis]
VCTDSLMIPMDKTHAELSVDFGEPSAAGRLPTSLLPVWHVAKMVSTLVQQLAGYRTAKRLMRSRSHGETTTRPLETLEPSVHSERQRSRSPSGGRAPS